MSSEPKGGLAALVLVKVVCCGGLVLFATGALGGVGAWLFDGNLIWLAVAGLALAAGLVLRSRRIANIDWSEDAPAPRELSNGSMQELSPPVRVSNKERTTLQNRG